MSDFVIHTDSGCDLPRERLSEMGVELCELTFRFNNSGKEYRYPDMPSGEFYRRMREGQVAKTAAVNTESFIASFRQTLNRGKDILYLGFSSAISSTFSAAVTASEVLLREYPQRKIIYIDTLAASGGIGLLVLAAHRLKKNNSSIEETRNAIENLSKRLCIRFTVDDLAYLKRGGRISPATALVGTLVGIKPILRMDDFGRLIPYKRVRGRKGSIMALADEFGAHAEDKLGGAVFISHADCESDARLLERMLAEKYGATVNTISEVGPVIGSHSGPGTLALFFIGRSR